ncbi:nickel pincer cofactor biosynthesis protein LarB [Thalassospira australica]|uniref:nickel pincer cofactor biosynthesis protein LarB n=1 Tax=Thalassospira australica TaxID=1528106 RepID=UPI00051A6B9C|nr:nickel pincer cofactor biosynthesis protein LarB [Thalassospira australica]
MTKIHQPDWDRQNRTGFPEAIYCARKSPEQINIIIEDAISQQRPLLLTALAAQNYRELDQGLSAQLDYDQVSATAMVGEKAKLISHGIGIIAAGTSDIPVATEAQRTLAFCGCDSTLIQDVGVAGLWRLLDRIDEIKQFRIIIALAGMEGALFSVLAGLVEAPVIAVPTSVGYGVTEGGRTALESALGSCAPGLMTVNIDNGFGAAAAAIKILNAATR